MRISGLEKKATIARKASSSKSKSIANFSNILDSANKEQVTVQLDAMINDIDRVGKKLISTRSVEDAREYKEKIKEYLELIVKNIYILKKETGPYSYGVHIRIEVIDEKLDALTKDLISNQQESIELASRISEIRGLLVDIYK
ncbi:MAG: YaaR family protein [Clostridium sp.]|uniref:YaaR family protein n=1 Tax=Clostridium sp. TaxID=1506 RepID=UPI002FC9F0B5